MQKKKENFLVKIVKKDYDNKLEEVLETKKFDENVKNLLLEILYKVEISYNDYKNVKRNAETKEEYITKIIEIIESECEDIELVVPNSQEESKVEDSILLIDKEQKKIICLPIERELLYCIAQMGKQSQIINEEDQLINEIITNAINEGNSINMVEPLRDFNGWSWTIIKKEIENISYNLVYQNLRILMGNDFLLKWIYNKEYIINYYEVLKNEIEEKYSAEIKDKLIYKFEEICILVERETNEKMKQKINRKLKEVEVKLEKTKDKRKYIDEIANDRTQIKNEIKRLDIIMADKNKIKDEFKNRNKELPIKEKIFSIKTLIQMLNNEKEKLKEEYEEKTNLLHPNIFLEKREEEKKKYELLQDKDIEETLIQFQEIFLEAFLMKVESIDKKEDLINVIYEFRYYQMLPFDEKTNIYEKEKLKEKIKEVEEKILEKAIENKVINENIQKEVFHYIFITKIIHLEDIYIQVKEDNKSIIVELSENDQGQCEERFEINKEEINENNIFGCYKDGNRVKLFN